MAREPSRNHHCPEPPRTRETFVNCHLLCPVNFHPSLVQNGDQSHRQSQRGYGVVSPGLTSLPIRLVLTISIQSNDILRKHGILPTREEAPRTPTPPPPPSLEESIEGKTPDELARLAEEEDDSDTERVIEAYRRKRLAEMRTKEKTSAHGEVQPIGRDDYAREVTEASKVDDPLDEEKGLGTGVVVVLYKDG